MGSYVAVFPPEVGIGQWIRHVHSAWLYGRSRRSYNQAPCLVFPQEWGFDHEHHYRRNRS